MKTKDRTLITSEVRERLRARYKEPAWILLEEVRNQTGFASGTRERYADALALSTYPSHGVELHGFEIKVSRGDLKKEFDDPEKALAFQKYCARWYLVVGRSDLVTEDEVPPNWGLMVPSGTGLKIKRKAKVLEPMPWPVGFVASLVRCAHGARPSRSELEKALKIGFAQGERLAKKVAKRNTEGLVALKKQVVLFNEHSGIDLQRYTRDDKIKDQAALFRQLSELDVEHYKRTATKLMDRLQGVVDLARKALA